MQLKEYQQGVLHKLEAWLDTLQVKFEDERDFVEFQKSKGKTVALGDYCREAWDHLNEQRMLPYARDAQGNIAVAHYLSRQDGLHRHIPNICLKVPTGGGKTLLAAAALERIQTDYLKRQTGFVVWVVPTDAIYRQTWKQLANREHPYRQMLERASGGRVKVLEKTDAFTAVDVSEYLCVMLLMLPSANRQSKETLRMFRDSGRFTSFFPPEDDGAANQQIHSVVPNLDCNDLADSEWANALSIKHSLGNVLRLLCPVIIVDEGHKAYSETARATLCGFNPCFILELSATPNTQGKHQSNVLVNVPGTDLKDEEMIKLPINIINEDKGGWKHTLSAASHRLDELQKEAGNLQAENGRYIRPILLIRVERTGKDQRDAGFVHAEDVREYLLQQLGIKPEEIRLKTSELDELGDDNLLADTCPVRYIITKDALREGWDCPFAYILAILSRTTAETALTQMIGRVLRQPHAQRTHHAALDECYVYTFDQEVKAAVDAIKSGLQEEGMADLASHVQTTNSSGSKKDSGIETVRRRKKFSNPPVIFLPRILHREKQGYRLLDYDRDILGNLDWESFVYRRASSFDITESQLRQTVARISLHGSKQGKDQIELKLEEQVIDELPDEGLDRPFLVRQLLDVIPNPWQGMRVLDNALSELRQRQFTDMQLYANRLDLLHDIKLDIREQLATASENLFRNKLESGDICLHLVSANDPALNWQIHETIDLLIEHELRRKNGTPIERSLFEKMPARDFNELEKQTAWYLDDKSCVYWWHRIAVNQRSYSLQGWQRQKVYPDLLACIQEVDKDKMRVAVLETKGEHLKGNDDTEYKRRLFALLTEYAAKATNIGELDLGQPMQMTFAMLMENSFSQELAQAGIV